MFELTLKILSKLNPSDMEDNNSRMNVISFLAELLLFLFFSSPPPLKLSWRRVLLFEVENTECNNCNSGKREVDAIEEDEGPTQNRLSTNTSTIVLDEFVSCSSDVRREKTQRS